ncbi:MAG TPA: hypothetical protein VFK88_02130 [Gallionella sp.]|nr:hypothetical protein [Gallionella sp.]
MPTSKSSSLVRVLIVLVAIGILVVVASSFLKDRETLQGGEALGVALTTLIEKNRNPEQALVARAILDNFHETRANAARWSGVYWGCTFAAAILSALAALILKLESLVRNEAAKKDFAAVFSVVAALLITISTSGDFQRKWQANRIAAAELERVGYKLLEKNPVDARSYLDEVGQILLRRHLAVIGGTEPQESTAAPPSAVSPSDK